MKTTPRMTKPHVEKAANSRALLNSPPSATVWSKVKSKSLCWSLPRVLSPRPRTCSLHFEQTAAVAPESDRCVTQLLLGTLGRDAAFLPRAAALTGKCGLGWQRSWLTGRRADMVA